jgi:Ca-activated chloride channel homolog
MRGTPALPSFVILIAILASSATAGAQSVLSGDARSFGLNPATGIVFSREVNEVNLAFTVTDKKGRFVSNLGPEDFALLDNHLPPENIRFFQRQSDLPIKIALLIDASDSTQYRFEYERNAAKLFLKKILRKGKDQALLIGFNSQIHVAHDFTDDVKDLSKALKRVKPGGNTALYDAIVTACERLGDAPRDTRRAVIVITDGIDTASHAQLEQAREDALRSQVTIFTLTTNDPRVDRNLHGDEILDLLSDPTGGRLLPARDQDHLLDSFAMVEKTLRNQYAVGYEPAEFKPDGSYRHVLVAPVKRGLRVHCRKGYFARLQVARNH